MSNVRKHFAVSFRSLAFTFLATAMLASCGGGGGGVGEFTAGSSNPFFNQGGGGQQTNPIHYALSLPSYIETAVSSSSVAMAVGDSRATGRSDIAILTTSDIKVYFNDNDGTMGSAVTLDFGDDFATATARTILWVDLDNDGDLDIVAGCSGAATVLDYYIHNADDTFEDAEEFTLTAGVKDMIAADFNQDGYLDIAYSDDTSTAGKIGIALNATGVGFTDETVKSVTTAEPTKIVAGDFDGDGIMDIVAMESGDDTVTFYAGNNDGSLDDGEESGLSTATTPLSIVAADFDGDGYTDLVVLNATEIVLLTNDGTGEFAEDEIDDTLASGSYVALGTSGGNLFVAKAGAGSTDESLIIYSNDGEGAFELSSSLQIGNYTLSSKGFAPGFDADGNNVKDVYVLSTAGLVREVFCSNDVTFTPVASPTAAFNAGTPLEPKSAGASFVMNDLTQIAIGVSSGLGRITDNGDGTYTPATVVDLTGSGGSVVCVKTEDFDGDDDTDVLALASDGKIYIEKSNGTTLSLFGTSYAMGTSPERFMIADLDGANELDVVAVDNGSTSVVVRLGNGSGGLGSTSSVTFSATPKDLYFVDVDGDDDLDLCVLSVSGGMEVSLNNGSGSFGSAAAMDTVAGTPVRINYVGDKNGDDFVDMCVSNTTTVLVYKGEISDAFADPVSYALSGGTIIDSTAVDMNGDGKLDIVAILDDTGSTGTEGTVAVLLGQGDGTELSTPIYYPAGLDPVSLTVVDIDGDGKPDLVIGFKNGRVSIETNQCFAYY